MASFYEGDGEEAAMDVGGGGGAPDPAPAPAQSAGAPGGGAAGRINIVRAGGPQPPPSAQYLIVQSHRKVLKMVSDYLLQSKKISIKLKQ